MSNLLFDDLEPLPLIGVDELLEPLPDLDCEEDGELQPVADDPLDGEALDDEAFWLGEGFDDE